MNLLNLSPMKVSKYRIDGGEKVRERLLIYNRKEMSRAALIMYKGRKVFKDIRCSNR